MKINKLTGEKLKINKNKRKTHSSSPHFLPSFFFSATYALASHIAPAPALIDGGIAHRAIGKAGRLTELHARVVVVAVGATELVTHAMIAASRVRGSSKRIRKNEKESLN
jgi:hypothetical protein